MMIAAKTQVLCVLCLAIDIAPRLGVVQVDSIIRSASSVITVNKLIEGTRVIDSQWD